LGGLLGPDATYEGDLVFEGRVRIDGCFVGSIRSEHLLEVGPQGRVEGQIHVAQILVLGTVVGTIIASQRATFLETAVVKARVVTPWLDVRPGCRWTGEAVIERPEHP
jgi:cytoskeletal protein CcmA (bactofilin family)